MKQAKVPLDLQRGQHAMSPPEFLGHQALTKNKETSYKNWLKVQASNIWWRELMFNKTTLAGPGKLPAYVQSCTATTWTVSAYTSQPST